MVHDELLRDLSIKNTEIATFISQDDQVPRVLPFARAIEVLIQIPLRPECLISKTRTNA